MANVSVAAYENAMKRYYDRRDPTHINYKKHPFLAMLAKADDFEGFDRAYPVGIESPQGVSNTFTKAQDNRSGTEWGRFIPTRKRIYGVVGFDNELLLATRSQRGAHVRAKIAETNGVFEATTRRLAGQLFRNGGGALGQITVSGSVATFQNPEDVVNVAKNMKLVGSTADGTSGTLKNSGDTVTVTAVNRNLGNFTFSTNGSYTPATNDYVFPEGDWGQAFTGLDAWIPAADPTSGDNFMGEDRSDDPSRLAGVRIDANVDGIAGATMVEKIKRGVARLKREGGEGPDLIIMNDDRYAELELELEGRKQIAYMKSPHAGIGFDVLKVHCGGKTVNVMADHNSPNKVAWMLTMSTWKLAHLGAKLPMFLTPDQKLLFEAAADGWQTRIGGYGDLLCYAPGLNGRIDLDI